MRVLLILIVLVAAMPVVAQPFITNDGITLSNSATLTTNGSWINQGAITNDGTIITSEDWINNGTLSAGSTGGFVLNYAGTKTFNAGGLQFGFLRINGGVAEVGGSIHLKDSLNLAGGNLKMLNANTLGLAATAVLIGGSSTSYVIGSMRMDGTGDKWFPIGNDQYFLPIKFYKVSGTAPEVTVAVEPFPVGFTPGPAVVSFIAFPYAWRTSVPNAADTASYVEIEYPNSLPTDPQAVVVRKTTGKNEFQGMGARASSEAGGRVTIRSYARGLKGLFSVANGFPGNLVTDSLALVSLYNSTGGANWTSKTNWLQAGTFLNTWTGVTQTGASVTALNLSNNNLQGAVPEDVLDINGLQNLNLGGNLITSLPELSKIGAIQSLDVSGNNLDFSSLEKNVGIATLNYVNQRELGTFKETQVDVGSDFVLSVEGSGGTADQYQWKRNDTNVELANANSFTIESIGRGNMGDYVCEITNPLVPGLMLKTAAHRVLATATLSGKLLINATQPATKGKVTLYRVEPGAFQIVATKDINQDGSYALEKIVLDDYQLLGFADTITHVNALPTYYRKTIFWEEADTLKVLDNAPNLDIVSEFKPTPPRTGPGEITGVFYDVEEAGGRVLSKGRVSKAGASLRRVERTGRPKEDILTLISYVFTNDEGEFNFDNLDPGTYRLNLQYPGYPMDESSFVNIEIKSDIFGRSVGVTADVIDGKIVVQKLVITGFDETEVPLVAYPNPSQDFVFMQSADGSSATVSLEVFDVKGQAQDCAISFDQQKSAWMVDVSQLPTGQYIIRALRDGRRYSLRIIVNH